MFRLTAVAATAAFCLAACATRPLPEDVTGVNTYEIVRRVRCEMRDSIKAFVLGLIAQSDESLARRLAASDKAYRELDRSTLHPDVERLLERYDGTFVGYEFSFDITLENHIGGSVDLIDPLARGAVKIGLSGENNRQRRNTRTLNVVDDFESLSRLVTEEFCSGTPTRPNRQYPVVGKLGLQEMVNTFLNLNQSGNLSKSTPEKAGLPTMSDSIAFTTRIVGSANPTVQLSPKGSGFQFAGANLSARARREDVHKVNIVLTLVEEQKTGARAATIAEGRIRDELDLQRQRELSARLSDLLD